MISGAQACREVRRAAGGLSLDAVNLAGLGCGSPLPPPPKVARYFCRLLFCWGNCRFSVAEGFSLYAGWCQQGEASLERETSSSF